MWALWVGATIRESRLRHFEMRLQEALVACALLSVTALASLAARATPWIPPGCPAKPKAVSIGERASCPFSMDIDVDPTRIPSELPTVKCDCVGSLCSFFGDYRCQEVRSKFQVVYFGPDGCSSRKNETVELPTSCVCVFSLTASAATGTSRTKG